MRKSERGAGSTSQFGVRRLINSTRDFRLLIPGSTVENARSGGGIAVFKMRHAKSLNNLDLWDYFD